MENNPKLERVLEAIRYLKGHNIISKQQDIVDKMGYSKSSISSALNGNEKYFTDNFIKKFNKAFGDIFNNKYLINGFGEMLMEEEAKHDSNIRFLTLYDTLKKENNIESDSDFCNKYNFNSDVLRSIIEGRDNINEIHLESASSELKNYQRWIFTGENSPFSTGEFNLFDSNSVRAIHTPNGMVIMHKNAWSKVKQSLSEYAEFLENEGNAGNNPKISYTSGVPYYNIDFIGGFDLVMNDQTIKPEYLIDFKKYNEADCWCNVTGHSMEPEITHGDMIALKKIEDMSFIPFGEVYAIVTTNDMRTIKRLGPSSNNECYSLIPTNKSPEYGIQEIPKKMIRAIFHVLGCMKRL